MFRCVPSGAALAGGLADGLSATCIAYAIDITSLFSNLDAISYEAINAGRIAQLRYPFGYVLEIPDTEMPVNTSPYRSIPPRWVDWRAD
jgi:hypothetical protein